jgi:sugar-specific transcriptional regulator TrmB
VAVARRSKDEKSLTLLCELGMIRSQARVYLTLARFNNLTASRVSALSGIARPDTYRTLSQLERAGFVSISIDQPKRYRAVPVDECFSTLILRRIEKTAKLKQETLSIVRNFREETREKYNEEEREFMIIPQREPLYNQIRKMVRCSEKSICLVGTKRKILGGILIALEAFKEALSRKISFRLILVSEEPLLKNIKQLNSLCAFPTFSWKHFSGPIIASFGVYDGKEILLSRSAADEVGQHTALWSTNKSLVDLAQAYFDFVWKEAEEPRLRSLVA